MNSHDVTVLGYLAVLLAGIVLQLLATRTRAPIPPLGKVFAWAMSTRTRRVGLLVAWAWVGLHFFARLSRSGEPGAAIPVESQPGHQRMFPLVAPVFINVP